MHVQCVRVNSCFVQDNKPLGTIPLAGNKLIRHPDDLKLPNQYRFEIASMLYVHMQG